MMEIRNLISKDPPYFGRKDSVVEASLSSTMGGISSNMNFMVIIKNDLSLFREVGAETTG